MNDFTIGGAWTQGYQFVAPGAAIHFLILVLMGIVAPLVVQYALVGGPINSASSPMTSGPAMMQMIGVPSILLAVALAHLLQAGSYFAALRFGFDRERAPVGAVAFGLAAGLVALLVIAGGYVIAFFGGWAVAGPSTVEIAVLIVVLPMVVVYSLFFISQAIIGAATILLMLVYLFVVGAFAGYPEAVTMAFGSGVLTIMMLLLSGLLFWLAARFSCATALMAARQNLNVFSAIGESWRLTADEQWPITRYLALVGFGIALLVIAISLVVGASTGGLMQGQGLGMGRAGDTILRLLFGIPVAFLSVMLPAGIYRQLTGEETPAEVFD